MITPLRDQVYVELTALNEPQQGAISVVRLERQPSTRARVLAIGEDVRDVQVGERVIISRLQGIEVGEGRLLIVEDAVLGYDKS